MWILIGSFLGLSFCLFRPFHYNNAYLLARLIGKGVLFLSGFKIIFRGQHYFHDAPASAVIISNHQDNLDAFLLGSHIPKRTVSIGKKSIVYFPLFGLLYWLTGNILIDRSNRKRAMKSMKKAGEIIRQKKIKVWIMPEGTRSKGRGLLPFKKGAFHLAVNSGLPLIPVVASSYSDRMNQNVWKKGNIIIEVMPPISAEKVQELGVEPLKAYCENLIRHKLTELDQESLSK